ncbi:MAG TPA: class I SAM-dependent methyltransferase [Burkholderiaceae bacterium]|nr:class I SAM-dependent methyltransferase [Burkholderiaceae bacterium]
MSLVSIPRLAAISCAGAALFVVGGALAQPKSRADCEASYKPQVGQSGKDVVWVPTPDELVDKMLRMAKTTAQDYVIDLGAGDGKIAIAAAKSFGATALGVEYNPDMVKLANCMVQVEGVAGKAKIIHGDIFKEDFSKANVVTMYLLPELNLCVRHRVLAMRPGTRVVSHQFTMGDWSADESAEFDYRTAYLWIVPARVAGTWAIKDNGGLQATVALNQTYQKLTGEATQGSAKQPLVGAALRGDQLTFAFNDDKGVTRTFTGTVKGNQVSGTLRAAGGGETQATGTLQGSPGPAPWAQMASGCERFYKQ